MNRFEDFLNLELIDEALKVSVSVKLNSVMKQKVEWKGTKIDFANS